MATLTWTNTSGGDWNTAGNWSSGTIPTATDDVVINGTGALNVTVTSADAAQSIDLNDPYGELEIEAGPGALGVLTLGGTLAVQAGTLAIEGGTIIDGVIEVQPGGSLTSAYYSYAVLSGVTLASASAINIPLVQVTDGLTLEGGGGVGAGTIDLTTGTLVGSQTLAGGTIVTEASPFSEPPGLDVTGGTVTLAPSLSFVSTQPDDSIVGDVVNEGGVTVDAGAVLTVGSGGTFDNAGGLTVEAGGTLVLAGGFENTGSITIDGAVAVGGNVTVAEIQSYESLLSTPITIVGTVDNTGSTLAVGSGTDVGTLVVGTGGVVEGGTIVDAGGGLVVNGGTLSGVTYEGTLAVSGLANFAGNDTFAGVSGGRGGIDVLNGGIASFQNGQTIDNVNIQLNGSGFQHQVVAASLTLGSNTSLIEASGSSFVQTALVGGGTIAGTQPGWMEIIDLVNNGLVTVTSGGIMTIESLQNSGNVAVSNGGVLYLWNLSERTLDGALTNSGTITETNATITFDTPIDLPLLSSVRRSGGELRIGSTLALGGGTLDVGAGSALGQLRDNGIIVGGTIHDAGGGLVFSGWQGDLSAKGGTLAAITYQGTLNLIPAESTLTVTGGLSVTGTNGTGPGTINVLGNSSCLDFSGSQAIDNVTINVGDNFNATNLTVFDESGAAAVLTLGPHATIAQWGARAAINLDWNYGNTLVNDGIIGAVATNGEMLIEEGTLLNNGSMIVANGETLNLQVDDLTNLSGSTLNGGSWTVYDGSTLDLGYNNQVATLNAALYLGGPGAVVQSLNSATGLETTLNQSLQTIGDGGELVLANGASFDQTGVLRDFGRVVLAGGTLAAQPLAIFPNADVIGFGTLAGTIYNSGIVMAQGGNLALNGAFYPGGQTGAAWINVGATLTASSALAVPVRFIGSTGELVLEQANATVGTISGFTGSDLIDLRNVSATGVSLNFSGGVLTVATNGTTDAALHFAGNYVTGNFSATSDGHGGTLIKDPPVSLGMAAPTLADFGGVGASPSGGGGSGGAAGTIAAPSVVGMAVASEDSTHGGAVAMLNLGH